MAAIKQKRLAGSTLIEVLIAMVIIMAVFSIATAVFSNVISSGVSVKRIRTNAEIEKLRLQVLNDSTFIDQHFNIDSIGYEVKFLEGTVSGATIVEIEANDHGKAIGKIKFLMQNKNGYKKD